MPIGLFTSYRPDEDNEPSQFSHLQLPNRQVDPYMRTILNLQNAGLLSQRFVQDQIANPLLRQDFLDTGVVGPRQPFGPGQSNLTPEEREKLANLRRNIAVKEGDHSQFIPREHTEPSGWIKMLEVFGAFNFAVAGASNALVNLYQGETEEINPFVEAYRGFTLKDKEIFGDVLENMGWEGEDGFAYWSRETLGFILDVVADPINFIALGSPQAARLARGVATSVRLRGTSKIGSSTVKPVREFANITSKIVNKGLEGLERGDAFKLGSVDSNRRVQSFKEAARRNLDPQYEAGDINKAVLEAQESVARLNLEDGVRAEVDAVFAMMARHNDPRTLRKLLEESRGGPDKLRALQAAIGGDMDGEISGEILRHFLSLENKDPNIENVIEFLTSRTGGIRNIIDPGGLQLRVPFTDKGVVIAEAQWLDDFALSVETGIIKALGIASTFTPGPIKTGLSAVAKTIVSGAKKTSQAVGKAFGADARRSGVLHALLTNRAARLNTGMANATEETKKLLTWKVAGKDEALPTELYEPLVDVLLAEQDNAMNQLKSGKRFFDQRTAQAHIDELKRRGTPGDLRRAQEIEDSIPRTPDGQRSLLGYEEKHIPGMGPVAAGLRAQGYSDAALEELERIARAVNDAFINQYDSAVKAGVEMQYMDYYLPVQYSGWAPPRAVQMAADDATGRVSGKDIFAQARMLTREDARELGLTASTDLYGLIYNRMFQGRRVQIERQFVSQLVEKLAVHPGQVGKVLRRMYGPASAEGQDLIQVLLNQSNYEELLTTENLGVLIPNLDDLRDLVQTGDFEKALRWIEAKEDLIPLLSTGEGRTQFFDAVQADIQAGLGTLTDYVDGITTADKGFLAAEQKLSNALGANAADIDRLVQDLGIVEEGAPAIGAAIRTIMQEKLRRILPDANLEGLTSIDVLKRTTGERDWIRLESAAPDTGKLVILMNALDDATPAGNRIKDQLLARVPGLEATIDDITEGLAETITEARRLVPDNTVVAARMEEQLLQMALSAIPGSSLENFVRRSTILPRGVNESQVYSKLQEVFDLELAGKSREAAALTEELVDQYARHPDLIEWYNDWRKSHGMPDDPSMPLLPDRIALQNRIISVMREAKEHTYKSGMEMFRKPVYAPGPQLPSGQKRLSALEKMKDKVRSELGSNSERFLNVLDLVRAPTTAMPGYHYSPLSATKSAVLKLYAQEGSSVLELITRTSARLEPSAVISRLGTEKAMFSGLTRSVVGQPTELMGLLKELNEGTTLRMAEALRRIPGADPEAAQRLVIDLESELSRLASARTGSDVILTQVHEETALAFKQFTLGLEKILPTEGGRTLMLGAINDMKNSLLESNHLSLELYQTATKLSEKITRLVENPAAILSANPDDILQITQEVVALRDKTQEMMVKADKATRELLGPNNPHPAGWDEITETEHLSNVLLGNAEDLHRDMQSIFGESQELADAFQTSQLEIARGKRTDAAQALAAIDQELLPIEAQVNDIVTRVGYVRQAESLQTSAFRRLATLDQNFASGNGLSSANQEDVLRTFLELGVADEFLRGKDYTPTGWAAAVERVGTQGPSQGTLKAWWREVQGAPQPVTPTAPAPPARTVVPLTDADKSRLREIHTEMAAYSEKGRLTAAEADEFEQLGRETDAIQFRSGSTADISKVGTAEETMSTLSPGVVVAINRDLYSNRGVFTAVRSATRGVGLDAETAIDATLRGINPDASAQELHEAFAGTRAALREQYGDTITLYRAEGAQRDKPTQNWATTREFVEQFGDDVVERNIPVDSIVAANSLPSGKYHELVVAKSEFIPTTPPPAVTTGLNDAVLFQQLEEIATGQSLRPADAQLWAAQRRPPFLGGPTGEGIRDAARAAVDSVDPAFLDELGIVAPDLIARADATARNASAFRENTEQLIARMADGAFLPDQTLREIAESVHYERKFLEALVNEMTSQQGLVESLFGMRSPVGRRVLGRFRLDLEEVLIQQRGDLYRTQAGQLIDDVNSTTAELLVLATADRQAALVRLGEIVGPGADVSHLIDSLSDAASQMSQLPTARQFRDLVSRIQTSVDDLYRPAVDLLDDQASARVLGREGVPQFFSDNLAQHPNDPLAQWLNGGTAPWAGGPTRLQDGELSALEQLMKDINGPSGASPQPFLLQLQNAATGAGGATASPEFSRRAQYWLSRLQLGYGGGAVGNAGMTIDQSNTLLERLGRYRGRNRAAEAVGFADDFLVKDKLPALRQSATTKYEARGVLSNEIAFLDEAIPRMETRTYTSNQLDYKPGQVESWRGMFAMQNYLELQVRRAEHLALNQVVQQLPSRADLNYMLLRAQTGALDASEETLETLRNARLQGAGEGRGVLSPEHTIALEEVTAGRRVHIEEAGEFVFAHAGKKVRDLTGIDFQKLDIQYGTDVPVSQQFLAQVGIELEKLGPERFANMGGSEGSRLIQEVEGRLVVADSIEAAGVRTDANADFANGVAQVHDYLKLVETEGGTLSNVPALDLQKVQLNRALNWFFPGPVEAKTAEEVAERLAAREQKKLLLQAVVGHQNIDKLSSSEASAVLYYLQTNTSVDVTNLGRRAQKLMERADYNLMGLRERGLVPPHLERKYRQGKIDDAELLEEFQKLKLDPDDPELPVKLSFPGMANDIDPGWGIQGRPLGEAVFVPQWVQQAVKSAVSPEGEIGPVARGMLRVSDSFTNSFKWAMTLPWPAFHFRNVLDAAVRTTFAMGIKGLSPTWNRKVFEIMRANPSAKMTFGGVEYNAKTLLNMFEDLGGQVTFSEKIGKTAVTMDISDSRILSPFSSNFVIKGANSLADGASTIAGTGDNFFRLSVWLDGMDKGMGATGAMQHAQKFLFDYANGLSPFERSFMRRVFPFYTFSRFNVPLQLGLMFKRPGIISAMGKTHNLLSESRVDPIDELLPSYVREQWRFGPKIEDGQLKIWSGRNLLATEELGFLGDLATWRGKGTPEIFFDEIFARLNPMLKIPVELYMGHNLYFNTKIAEDQTIRGAVLDWPVVREFLQMRKVKVGSGEDARVLYRVNGNRFHLLNQLHFSRLYRSIVSIVGPEDGETWERFVPFITGLRLTSIDLGRRLQHLESVANFNQENIRKALSQGDWVAVERILFGTERQPYQQLQLVEQLKSLEQLTQITSK